MSRLRAQVEALVRRDAHIAQGDAEEVIRRKVDGFFWPLFQWVNEIVDRTAPRGTTTNNNCVCIGFSCVQGGGKTTATRVLQEMMQLAGRRCAVISLDDVYVTREQQIAIAKENASNPLLQHRGNPGTHDLPLLMRFIDQCRNSNEQLIAVPRYDKSLHNGRGDRLPESAWDQVQGPLDVLLIEGWCLGFRALASTDNLDPNLIPINQELVQFEELYQALDAMVVVQVETPQWVYTWREQQEAQLRNANKPALSSDQVRDFVDRFMPSYKAYLPGLYEAPSSSSHASRSYVASHLESIPRLVLEIDVTRTPSLGLRPVEFNIHSETLQSVSDSLVV